jgi:BlaI family transcriptional regulator, penicillinase repressor
MRITEAESKVLEVFWRADAPLSAEDVVAAMDNDREWSAGTIRTFLTRLVKKKALAATPDGRRYLYSALIPREDYVHDLSRDLIDRLFGGRITPFLTQFSERQRLSRDEIDELKRLIERLDHDR